MRHRPLVAPAILAVLLCAAAAAAAPIELGQPYLVRDIDRTGEPYFEQCILSACPPPVPIYGSLLEQLTPFGDRIVFVADDRVHGFEPWVSDGTEEGTLLLADVCEGECGSGPLIAGALGNRMLFWASPGTEGRGVPSGDGYALWATDGTPQGTRRLDELCPTLCDVRPETAAAVPFQGYLFFQLDQAGRIDLWRTDGTPEGTARIRSVCPVGSSSCYQGATTFVTYRDQLFFTAAGDLWRLRRPDVQPVIAWAGEPTEALVLGDRLLLVVTNGLWVTDDPRDEPVEVVSFLGKGVGHLTRVGDEAYFVVVDDRYQRSAAQLWHTDGSRGGTERMTGTFGGGIGGVFAVDDRPVFSAADTLGDPWVLWRLNADDAPRILLDLPVGLSRTLPGRLLITATDAAHGDELWVTDGTVGGTRLVDDLAPGPLSSFPGHGGLVATGLQRAGDRVFFAADHPESDIELWALPLLPGNEPPPPPPEPPGDDWMTSAALPGFRVQVRITAPEGGAALGRSEGECIPETLCVGGAVEGRSEVFIRVVGPKPNGFLWPTLVKFTTSEVEIWIERLSTGPSTSEVRYYRLAGARPGFDELPGLFDRTGFPAD